MFDKYLIYYTIYKIFLIYKLYFMNKKSTKLEFTDLLYNNNKHDIWSRIESLSHSVKTNIVDTCIKKGCDLVDIIKNKYKKTQ